MSKEDRLILAKEARRKAVLFRDQEEMLKVNLGALKRRIAAIPDDTSDQYELQMGLMLTFQVDILELQIAASYGEALKYEGKAKRLESDLQFENDGEPRPKGL